MSLRAWPSSLGLRSGLAAATSDWTTLKEPAVAVEAEVEAAGSGPSGGVEGM